MERMLVRVLDLMGVADDLYKEKGKSALLRLVKAMRLLERTTPSKGIDTSVSAALKRLKPARYNLWEYRAGELRFYFYIDVKADLAVLIGYSTKDRQKNVIQSIVKRLPKIRALLQRIAGDSEQ